MSTATKSTYRKDLIAQVIYLPMMGFYLLGIISLEFIIFGAILQFFVGLAQVLSGLSHVYYFGDSFHKKYLAGALSYLLFLYIAVNTGVNWPVLITILFIIPTGIATWYINKTWTMYKDLKEGDRRDIVQYSPYEDLLDDAMAFEGNEQNTEQQAVIKPSNLQTFNNF